MPSLLDLGVTSAVILAIQSTRRRRVTQQELAELTGAHIQSVRRSLRLLESHQLVTRSLAPNRGQYGPFYLYQWNGGQA